jgi:hypothetical protein
MMTKLHFPIVVAGPGMAMGVPIDAAIATMEATASALSASAEKIPGKGESFAQRLVDAVKAKQRPRRAAVSAGSPPSQGEETFAEKFARAVKRKSGQERRQQQAERERSRYLRQPRKQTKGE